jgi:hypothetical protein
MQPNLEEPFRAATRAAPQRALEDNQLGVAGMAKTRRLERLERLERLNASSLYVLLWDDFGWSGDIGVLAILDGPAAQPRR